MCRDWNSLLRHDQGCWHSRNCHLNTILDSMCSKCTLRLISMLLTLAVLLVCILYLDLLASQVLSVHVFHSAITSLEGGVADEAESLAETALVASDLWWGQEWSEAREGFVEGTLVNHGVETADKELGADAGWSSGCDTILVDCSLVCVGLVEADWLAVEADIVHDVDCICCIPLTGELYESITLVLLAHAVFWHMQAGDWSTLEHKLVDDFILGFFSDVADVQSAVFVLLPSFYVSDYGFLYTYTYQ